MTRFPLVAGEQVLPNKVVNLSGRSTALGRSLSFVIPEGKRGFAVTVSQVANAGGLVLPGDYVDILVIYDVEFPKPGSTDRQTADSFLVQTVLQNVEVLAVSQGIVDVVPQPPGGAVAEGEQRVRNSEASPDPEARTVTLALSPQEAQRLYLAEGNGRIRLAVRPYGDGETLPIDYSTELELFPPSLPNPFNVR